VGDLHQIQLDLAVRQRKQRNYSLAINNCTSLIEGKAPELFKRAAFIELALIAEDQNQHSRAIQTYGQYIKRFPGDPSIPEVFLRQGLLYRKMGAPVLAMSKFYAVLSSSLTLKTGNMDYFQRLVLQAQLEIADTYFMQGKLVDASDFFKRLLKQEAAGLNQGEVLYKLIRCHAGMTNHTETVTQGRLYLESHRSDDSAPEVRYLMADALSRMGQKSEALEQVKAILDSQPMRAGSQPTNWVYWQQRAGNLIANQLYQEGDYLNALMVYSRLAELSVAPGWQMPVWYQIGLIHEKLLQPDQAIAVYARIADRQKNLASPPDPGVKTVADMARWRTEFLNWQIQAQAGPARPRIINSQ
jgi:tetratricopeptide (TPR) repeat protein